MKKTILTTTCAITVAVLVTLGTSAASAQTDTSRPGWGKGDTHHVHTGPPGQSVRPDTGDVEERVQKRLDKVIVRLQKLDNKFGSQVPGLSENLQSLIARLSNFFS